MSTARGFGTPKFGGTTFVKTGKVMPASENFIRILPPLGSLADAHIWKVYWTTHWGYAGANPRDPSKTTMRPFRCIKDVDRRTKLVRQDCPACTKYDELKAQADAMEADFKAKGLKDDQLKTAMSSINEECKKFNAEARYYVNVVYKDGTVGDFKLNHRDHMTRINAIIEGTPAKPGGLLKNEGIDPFAPDQGVWFKITREGKGGNVPDTVELEMESIPNVVGGKRIKLAPLSEEICARALAECRDLDTLGGVSLTYDQIAALAACSGDPEEVDKIMGVREQVAQPITPAAVVSSGTVTTAKTETAVAAVTPSTNTVADPQYVVNGKVVTKEQKERYDAVVAKKAAEAETKKKAEAAAQAAAKKAAAEAAKAKLVAATPVADAATEAGVIDPMTQTDEEFMASLG